jgi:hypothetical protein
MSIHGTMFYDVLTFFYDMVYVECLTRHINIHVTEDIIEYMYIITVGFKYEAL